MFAIREGHVSRGTGHQVVIGAHLPHGAGIACGPGDGSVQESLPCRGIEHTDGLGSCQAVHQRFAPLTHGWPFVGIAPRTPALPPLALAAKLGPHGLKHGTTTRWRLSHPKRPPQQQGQPHRAMLRARSVVVRDVVAVVLPRVDRLMVDLPARGHPACACRRGADGPAGPSPHCRVAPGPGPSPRTRGHGPARPRSSHGAAGQ